MTATRATQELSKAGVAFTVHQYTYDPGADRIGLAAAQALGEEPRRVLKTLMAEVDGRPVVVIVPSDREVAMKKLAAAVGGKHAAMLKPADAERLTGYHTGGISPFGQKKRLRAVLEDAALSEPYVYLNGGQRGLQVKMAPQDVAAVLEATVASVVG